MVNENQKAKAILSKSASVVFAIVFFVLAVLIFAITVIVASTYSRNPFEWIGYHIEYYIAFYIISALLVVVGILVLVLNPIAKRYSLVVSDKRIYAKTIFKTVQLPLDKVTAVAHGIFKHVTVVTSRGRITFYFVSNLDEVVTAIEEQLFNK